MEWVFCTLLITPKTITHRPECFTERKCYSRDIDKYVFSTHLETEDIPGHCSWGNGQS